MGKQTNQETDVYTKKYRKKEEDLLRYYTLGELNALFHIHEIPDSINVHRRTDRKKHREKPGSRDVRLHVQSVTI